MTEQEPSITELMAEEPKRRRGRPPKTVTATVDGVPVEGETKTTRRPRKLTADDVTQMMIGSFDLVAMVRGPHWKVAETEVEGWSKNAADLLNRIPSRYAKGVIMANGYAMVAVGLYSVVAPRLVLDRQLRATVEGVQNGTVTPEEAQQVYEETYAQWTGPKR